MACLKMILAHRNHKVIPLVDLGKECLRYGGYDQPLETSNGLKYAPFVRYLKQAFNITATVAPALTEPQIMCELVRGNYVIVSVSPLIRDPASTPTSKGGHLVLILGYDTEKQELYLHNPSGLPDKSQMYAAVSYDDFGKFFSNKGIIVSGKT